MPGKVTPLVAAGPMRGRGFESRTHDTFLFGGSPDCQAELAAGDTSASRHHFLLAVTGQHERELPPDRDPLAVNPRRGVVPIRRGDPGVSRGRAGVLDRALADDASERYADAAAF